MKEKEAIDLCEIAFVAGQLGNAKFITLPDKPAEEFYHDIYVPLYKSWEATGKEESITDYAVKNLTDNYPKVVRARRNIKC